MTIYRDHARRMIENGWPVIPIQGGTKKPACTDWTAYATAMPDRKQVYSWSIIPQAGMGLVLGGTNRTVLFDIDTDDETIKSALLNALPPSDWIKRGAKGMGIFYRVAEYIEIPTTPVDVDGVRILDILSTGAQTVLPPSIHPKGMAYAWDDASLENAEPFDLPMFGGDDWSKLMRTLTELGWQKPIKRERMDASVDGVAGESVFQRMQRQAMASLDRWVPILQPYLQDLQQTSFGWCAVPSWRESTTSPGSPRRLNLKFHPEGIRDWGTDTGYSPIDLIMIASGMAFDEAAGALAAALGMKGQPMELTTTTQEWHDEPMIADDYIDDPADLEPIDDPADHAIDGAPDLDPALTYPPGLLGDIIDFGCASAQFPSRAMMLGAALVIVGTLVGRHWATPTDSGTHLYLVNTGPSGIGKDHPRNVIRELMDQCGCIRHVGPSDIETKKGLMNTVFRQPCVVIPIDEFGDKVRDYNAKNAPSYVRGISSLLKSLYSSSYQTMTSGALGDGNHQLLHSPAVSIYGAATLGQFYGALAVGDVEGGFLNRFVMINVSHRPPNVLPSASIHEPPKELLERMHALYVGDKDRTTLAMINVSSHKVKPRALPWADDAARDAYVELRDLCLEMGDEDPSKGDFLKRVAENALRMATIRALGIDHLNPMITVEDVQWGRAIAMKSAMTMHGDASDLIGATDQQKLIMSIVKFVREQGRTTHRDLTRKFMGKTGGRRAYNDLIDSMVEDSQLLIREQGATKSAVWYRVGDR